MKIGSEWDAPITPDESVEARKKAYDKLANLQPALIKKQGIADTQLMNEGLQGAYQGITQGGFKGRQIASGAADQLAMQMAKAQAQNRAEQDAYGMETAQAKEDIISSKQQTALNQFNRQTQEMQDQIDRALTQRAFDMGITAKELIFHVNSKIADLGLKNLKDEFDKGLVGKQELETVKLNLQKDAAAKQQKAVEILHKLKLEMSKDVNAFSRQKALELQKQLIAANKEAAQKAVKAQNIGAIITSAFTIGGAVAGSMIAPGGGTVAGGLLGSKIGEAAGGIGYGAYNQYSE